jgi:hypothetical protein
MIEDEMNNIVSSDSEKHKIMNKIAEKIAREIINIAIDRAKTEGLNNDLGV